MDRSLSHSSQEGGLGRAVARGCGEAGLGASKVGSKCLNCAGSHRRSCAYAERWWREIVLLSSPVAGGVSPQVLPIWDRLLDEEAPGALQMAISTLLCPCDIYPAFSPRATSMSSELSQSQACWPSEFQTASPTGCKHPGSLSPLSPQADCCGGLPSLWTLQCAGLSLAPFYYCGFPSTVMTTICLSPKLCLHFSHPP